MSRSADHVMLKKWSSSQVLPPCSRKIWWCLFLWGHRNLHHPQWLMTYTSDTHDEGLAADVDCKNKSWWPVT
jgi:hypothetical protein